MNARMLALWVAYVVMLTALLLSVVRTDHLLNDLKEQNCAIAGLELVATEVLLLPETEFDSDQEADFAELLTLLEDLCPLRVLDPVS